MALHVRDLGAGPPVVLLHPGPGLDGSVFLPHARALVDAGFRALLVDLPGGDYRLTAQAAAVEGLMRELDAPTLLGHSFGGYVAMQHLVDFPGSAARLVASCTDADEEEPPGADPHRFENVPDSVAAAFEREDSVTTPEECHDVWRDQLPFFAVDPAAVEPMLDRVVFQPEAHRSRDFGDLHALDALAATDIPVLAIAGAQDRATPPAMAERIAATAPLGELLIIDGTGHFPFAEAPERYWPAVVFLHGEQESGTDNLRQTQVGLGSVLRAGHRVWPGVVVFPQKPDANVLWSARADLVLGVLAAARAAYPIDVSRIYLTGISQGGEGTWGIAAANPGTFAALVPVAGWSESPDSAAKALAGTPVWLFHGARDTVVPPARAQKIAAALQREGRAPRITIYAEGDHNAWDRTYRRRDLLRWLFRKRLVSEPPGPRGA